MVRILLDLGHQVLDGVIELDILPVEEALGSQFQHHIRIDAVSLDDPELSLGVPAAEFGLRRDAAVAEGFVPADSDPAAPGARADDRAHLEILELLRQRLAIAASLAVDEQ